MNQWHRSTTGLQFASMAIDAYWLWLLFRFLEGVFSRSHEPTKLGWMLLFQVLLPGLYWVFWKHFVSKDTEAPRWVPLGLLFAVTLVAPFLLNSGFNGIGGYMMISLYAAFRHFRVINRHEGIFFKLQSQQNSRLVAVFTFVFLTWMRDVTNMTALWISLSTLAIYICFDAYWVNVYKWRQKELDLIDALAYDAVLLAQEPGSLEPMNRPTAFGILAAALGTAGLCIGLWLTPPMQVIRLFFFNLSMFLLGLVSKAAFALMPKISGDYYRMKPVNTDLGDIKDAKSIGKVIGREAGYQAGYHLLEIAIITTLIIFLIWFIYKTMKQQANKRQRQTQAALATGTAQVLEVATPVSVGQPQKVTFEEPKELIRKQYRWLIKALKAQGVTLLPGDTTEVVSMKLAEVYPNHRPQIQLITEAYCAQRYGDGIPANLDEVLRAFEQLKEVKHDRSK